MVKSGTKPRVVAVTGASGYVGTNLLGLLEEDESLGRVLAIDHRPLPIPFRNVTTRRMDIVQATEDLFKDNHVDTVVHLAFILKPGRTRKEVEAVRTNNLKGLESVLNACRGARVKNLVYVSSHTVYGAQRANPIPITEEASVRPLQRFQYSEDKSMAEEMVRTFGADNPEVTVSVLRPCVVMGPGADNYVTRALFKPALVGVAGSDPPLQFVHEYDLASVLHCFINNPLPGTYNVAGDGVIHYSRMAKLSNRKLVFLPSFLAYGLVETTWKLGIQKESPSAGLNFVRHPIIMSTAKLKRDTGYKFTYTSIDALMSYLPDRNP